MENLINDVILECLLEQGYEEEDFEKKIRQVDIVKKLYINQEEQLLFEVKVSCHMVKEDKSEEIIRYFDEFNVRRLSKKDPGATEEIMQEFGQRVGNLSNLFYFVFGKHKMIEHHDTKVFKKAV